MKENIIQQKSSVFAIKIIETFKFLQTEKKEFVLSKQLLKSGTGMGAKLEEVTYGQSKEDFINRISVAYQKACETKYWIKLLMASEYLERREADTLLDETNEFCEILSLILLTVNKNHYQFLITNS
ncbi:MAG: four helix bundle protein [Chitinophagaceae bacterium]|nr:four helix bundle protein [Chitinophagaceae bacterium]